jgi:hypothetical protein
VLREELTAKLSDFESKQPVGDWLWHGWRVWPVVRTRLALALHANAPPESRSVSGGESSGCFTRRLAPRLQRLHRFAGEKLTQRPDRRSDVVFITATSRNQRVGRELLNTVVDPWAEALAGAGARTSVWDLGDPRWPGIPGHASIQRAMDFERRAMGAASPGPTPDWFERLASWATDNLEADLGWSEVERDMRVVECSARLFGEWLVRAEPRALVLDCWYGREAMGASLAAHRLGIPAVDLQHGIQGSGHPAYAGWSPPPAGGYEVFPDRFWVWGEWDAESLIQSNPGAIDPADVSVAGHRWLSSWREGGDPRHADAIERIARLTDGRRAVLVTLQAGVPYRETLLSLIRQMPRDWTWFLRLHGRMREEPQQLEAELRRACDREVDVVNATRLPLHALMRACVWHVTGFSTCALEALAFGVPTLLFHPSGEHAFSRFVEQQVMWPHQSISASRSLLGRDDPQLAAACRRAARRVFADPASPHLLLEGLSS